MSYAHSAGSGTPPSDSPSHSQTDESLPPAEEVGELGVHRLKRLWYKTRLNKCGKLEERLRQEEWRTDVALMNLLGLGLDQCLGFLYGGQPTFSEFEHWVLRKNPSGLSKTRIRDINRVLGDYQAGSCSQPLDAREILEGPLCGDAPKFLSESQVAFWRENGYLVVEDVLDKAQCQASVDVIYRFLQKSPDRPETWYNAHQGQQNIMVQLFRDPVLDANRSSEKMRQAFADIWGTESLQCSIDRAGFNPPETPQYQFFGTRLHWDVDFSRAPELRTQGLIYLTDVAENQGAFHCAPGFHRHMTNWMAQLPPGADPNQQDLSHLKLKYVAAPAGSLIIWHHYLPHGASPNRAATPRVVQYLNMTPLPCAEATLRK
ncbi:phytanoyl-CoA dioxygenase family protein [Hahella sp. CR1]|uniref:phytanoyl-CoA dioxygenase family protein n=1 Tax=Hahella sp. CR1 TaxID=2992807 RepID=UPI002441B309|nr:phytanoyl-CoA dioxygenase family protein [Hahella sp. CR1]MDG9670268.1 phytanoyl-CoA dioxygenase family protein [Hahella sp. CR1]